MKDKLNRSFFALIPLLLTVAAYITGFMNANVVDDIFMMKIAESFRTNPHSEQLMFSSEILGYFLKLLYKIIPAVNWFWMSRMVTLTVSFTALFKILTEKETKLIAYFSMAGLQLYFLANLNYTSVAFIAVGNGIIWYIDHIDKLSKENIKHIIISAFLIAAGFVSRINTQILLCMLLIFGFVFAIKLFTKKSSFAAIAVLCAVLVCSSFSVVGFHRLYNSRIPEKMYFTQFQEYRSAATDKGLYHYDESLSKLGFSENDLKLYRKWVYGDRKVFTNETLKAISEARDTENKYLENVNDFFKSLNEHKYKNTIICFAFLTLLLAIILFIYCKGRRWEILLFTGMTFAAVGYLFFRRRPLIYIVTALFATGICYLICIYADKKSEKEKSTNKTITVITAILCILAVTGEAVFVTQGVNKRKEFYNYSAVDEYAKENRDSDIIYLCDPCCVNSYETYNKCSENLLKPYNNALNIYTTTGDWYIYSHYWYDLTDNLGLKEYNKHAMKALLDDRVQFVTAWVLPGEITTYFKEHYNVDVGYKVIKTFPKEKIKIYKFYKK